MASNKSCRGTGNLLQDLLSSVVRLKKCDKQIIATNTVKSELKIKSQFIHCFICGVKHERRPLSKVKVEILQEIILKESFHGSVSPISICPLCSTTLEKLIDLRKKVGEISACIRSLIKLRHDLSELEDIEIQEASSEIIDNDNNSSGVKSCGAEIQNSTTEIIYNVTLNDENKDSSVGLSNGKSDDDDVDSEDEIMVPDFDDEIVDDVIVSINSKSSPNFETLTCLECNVTFDKSWKLNRHHRNPWLGRSERQNDRTNFTDNETNLQDFEEPDCLNVSKTVDNTSNEDVKKCESDISDYDCVPIDDLILEVVEESIKGSDDEKVVDLDVNLDGISDLISNYDGNFILDLTPELPLALPEIEDLVVHLDGNLVRNVIVETPELPLKKVDGEDDDGVNIEEFVQCKAEDESEELASIRDPAIDVAIVPFVTKPSGGLQIAKVKNEDGEEVKLFTNLDGVYEILPDFDSYPSIIPTTASPTLENLTCLECKVTFNKSWKLSRHQRNPWLDRSPQQNKKRSRLISNHDKEADLQNYAKRPRLLRIRGEKLIKDITKGDKLNNDDFDDSNDVLASNSGTSNEIKFPSDDESIYGEDVEISKKSGRYKCLKCNTTYCSMYNLGRHLKTIAHTGRNPPPDPRTGIVTHDELASLKCTVCAATFDDAETLTKHKSTHDKKCDICDHKFLHTKDLHRHLKTQKHAVALKCLKLNEGGVATFSCDQCDHVGFPDLSGLLQHRQKIHVQMLSEEEIATLRCTICSDKFNDPAALEKHKALHGNKCDVCNLKCRDLSGLNRHLQTNAHQSATRSRRLDSEGNVTFVCDQCPEVEPFPDPSKLIMHMKKYHQRILMLAKGKITSLKCTICSKKFDNKAALTNHKSSHGKKCDICDIEFSNEIELREHLESQKHAVSLSCRRLNDDSVDTYDQVEFPDLVDTIRGGSEGRSISKDETEADLQNHVKRPRLSRIRAEKLIKNLTNRVNLNNDENDDREDSDFNASSDNSTSTEVESSSDEESIYGEDKNNLSRPELNFDDTEICAESGRYKCLKCNTAYGSMYHLTRHLSTTFAHTGRIPSRHARPLVPTQNEIETLKCSICAVTFDDVETLTKHKSTHDNKCDICDHKFVNRKKLRKHLETKKHWVALKCQILNEDGVATFSCDKCDQVGFTDLSGLLQHLETVHKSLESNIGDVEVSKKSGRYQCLECKTRFFRKDSLRRHLETTFAHTGKNKRLPTKTGIPTQDEIASLKSSVCAAKFDDVATLTTHKTKYKKKCEICDLSFPHGQALRKHLKSQNHATALSCRKLNDDGVATFSCDKCDQVEYPDLLGLLQHRKQIHAAILSYATAGNELDHSTLVRTNAWNNMRCTVCERNLVLSSSNSVKQHLQSRLHQLAVLARRVDSDGKVSFVCDQCPEVQPFPSCAKFLDHRKKIHPGRSVFIDGTTSVKSCLPCDRVFYSVRAYNIHLHSMRHADTIGAKESVSLDFACNLCDRKYAANFQLKAHLASVHFEAVICEMCGTRCRDLAGLTAHQKKHFEPPKVRNRYIPPEDRRYPCKFCDKRFLRTYDRSKHVNSFHKGKRYKCDICQKTFPSSSGLNSHKKYVHNLVKGVLQPTKLSCKSQPIKCNICLKSVSREIGASHIELVHFQDKSKCPYACSDLEFETEQEWIQHLEGCTSEKITEASQSPCLVCDAVFRNQLLRLSHHHQTHETFPCEICSKLFSKQTTLNTHKYSHPESKPHLCSKCGQRFRQPRNLRLHLTTVCGDDDEARKKLQAKRRASDISSRDKKKNFNCNECSMGFITSRRFELHKEKVHGGQDDGGNGKSDTEDSDTDA